MNKFTRDDKKKPKEQFLKIKTKTLWTLDYLMQVCSFILGHIININMWR